MHQRGMTLVITLIITGVIAGLIMANMQSQQLATKVSNIMQQQQSQNYELRAQFKHFLLTQPWNNAQCIMQSAPQFLFPLFSPELPLCSWQAFSYVIIDGGNECCLFKDKKSAHIYHIIFTKKNAENDMKAKATLAIRLDAQICHCQSTSGIKDSLMNLQIG